MASRRPKIRRLNQDKPRSSRRLATGRRVPANAGEAEKARAQRWGALTKRRDTTARPRRQIGKHSPGEQHRQSPSDDKRSAGFDKRSAPPDPGPRPLRPGEGLDPLAYSFYRLLQDLPIEDRRYVWQALARTRVQHVFEKRALCIAALLTAVAELGNPTSLAPRRYDSWRARQPSPEDWPSSSLIRKVFNRSWPAALEAAGLRPSVTALRRRFARRHRPTPEAIVNGVRLVIEATRCEGATLARYVELGRAFVQCGGIAPTEEETDSDLLRLVRAVERAEADGLPVTFVSYDAIRRHIGSWRETLRRAGTNSARVRPHGKLNRDYTREGLADGLRDCAKALGERRLKSNRYDRWAVEATRKNLDRGVDRVYARTQTVITEFGGWPQALHGADLIDDEELACFQGHGMRQRSNRRMLEDLISVGLKLRQVPSCTDYDRYRSVPERAKTADGGRMANGSLFLRRFGSYEEAVAKAKELSPEFAALPDNRGPGRRYRRLVSTEETQSPVKNRVRAVTDNRPSRKAPPSDQSATTDNRDSRKAPGPSDPTIENRVESNAPPPSDTRAPSDRENGTFASAMKDLASPLSPNAAEQAAPPRLHPHAYLVAQVARNLPPRTAETLAALLARDLIYTAPAEARAARLGLLLQLIDGSGEVPSVDRYEEARAKSHLEEPDLPRWPSHSTLIRSYGSWIRAVRAAMALRIGRHGPTATAPGATTVRYTTDDILAAIVACRDCIGAWPERVEYNEYRRVAISLALHAGRPRPRLPEQTVIVSRYGNSRGPSGPHARS